jgi:hypothetical protein
VAEEVRERAQNRIAGFGIAGSERANREHC